MVGKLSRLPAETQQALQQLACLGNSAEFALLAMVYEHSKEEHRDLQEALRTGLVLSQKAPISSSTTACRKPPIPCFRNIRAPRPISESGGGWRRTPPEKREEAIFEIVNQLNRGVTLITSRDEREQLAELNLIAGKRAKASTVRIGAYVSHRWCGIITG